MNKRSYIRALFFMVFLAICIESCEKNPSKYIDNIYVGNWLVDTSRVNVSINIEGGELENFQSLIHLINSNAQDLRKELKEPQEIRFFPTTKENVHTGSYTFQFSNGEQYTGNYTLANNILYLSMKEIEGLHFSIPCICDGTTLLIQYTTPFMKAAFKNYIQNHFPDESKELLDSISEMKFTIEGSVVYNTRTRG